MPSWGFYTTATPAVLIFQPSKHPDRVIPAGRLANTVAGETLGGKVRSETRGSDRRTLRLTWSYIGRADAEAFDAWFATYGGGKVAFGIQLPTGAHPGVTGGTKLRVRCLMPSLAIPCVGCDPAGNLLYTPGTIDLIEDLT